MDGGGVILFERLVIAKKYGDDSKISRNFQIIASFLFAFIWYVVFAWHESDMISGSGDSYDIWQTITSFRTDNIYGSYVLYKGVNSIYPYVWLYDIAHFFGINEWIFIKLFYAGAFSYISAIGFPNMIELLVQKNTKMYRRYLCILLMWYFWHCTMALTRLIVDLPCLMYYVLLINVALKIWRRDKRIAVLQYIWAGILSGLCMSASGQYTMPALCIAIFIFWVTLQKNTENKIHALLFHFVPYLLFLFLINGWNFYFELTFVNSLRQGGAWIPSNKDWLFSGLVRFKENYRSGLTVSLPSYRNTAILQDYYGEMLSEVYGMTTIDYLKMVLNYPIDFILDYLNGFFIILSPDRGGFNLFPLLIFYTLLYCALYIGVSKCITWKQFFSPLFLIGFSFLWAVVPLIVMNIEPRTCMQIQGLVIALAVCDDTIWKNICRCITTIKTQRLKAINKISYPIVFYLMFICFCMLHISTLYEAIGANASEILIHIK